MPLTNRATRIAIGLIVILSLVAVGLLVYLVLPSTRGVATQQAQVTLQRRQDCAREISGEQNDVIRRRDALGWQALATLGAGGVEALRPLIPGLEDANRAVSELPSLQAEVERRCPKV